MPTLIKLEFKRSSSKYFAEALRIAKRFSGFAKEGKSGPYSVEICSMDELLPQWQNFSELHMKVAHWAGTKVFFNDKRVIYTGNRNDFFYYLLDIKQCYKNYLTDPYKSLYCSEGDFGCSLFRSLNRRIIKFSRGYVNYYKHGHFKNSTTWAIDKDKIKQILTDEAEIRLLCACPAFKIDSIYPFIAMLPDEIKLDPENWEISYEREYTENGFALIPKSIFHIDKEYPEMIDTKAFGDEISIPDNLTNEEANMLIEQYRKQY